MLVERLWTKNNPPGRQLPSCLPSTRAPGTPSANYNPWFRFEQTVRRADKPMENGFCSLRNPEGRNLQPAHTQQNLMWGPFSFRHGKLRSLESEVWNLKPPPLIKLNVQSVLSYYNVSFGVNKAIWWNTRFDLFTVIINIICHLRSGSTTFNHFNESSFIRFCERWSWLKLPHSVLRDRTSYTRNYHNGIVKCNIKWILNHFFGLL